MARRKIDMLEISEVLFHWQKGQSNAHISRCLGISRPTVRKYLKIAQKAGLTKKYDAQVTVDVLDVIYRAGVSSLASIGRVQNNIAIYDDNIRKWLSEPGVTNKKISQRLNDINNEFSCSSVNRYIRKIKCNLSSCATQCPEVKRLKVEQEGFVNDHNIEPYRAWILKLLQGKMTYISLLQEIGETLSLDDAKALLLSLHDDGIRNKNRALSVLCHLRGISYPLITKLLMISQRTIKNAVKLFSMDGTSGLLSTHRSLLQKHKQPAYKDTLFALLHSPPKDHGINRTSWTMKDLHRVMSEENSPINKDSLRKIIKEAGYRFRKAKTVLTSTDPEYQKKLEEITQTLAGLTETQRFFSIDEFGPFAVKMQGGRSLTSPNQGKTVPQWQKSKGSLTLVGALELSTNQITYFYSIKKNTTEMIKLTHILLDQYKENSLLYLSWDAASWHASKAFFGEIARLNEYEYRAIHHTPAVALVPLPASAQFLNVIESIFSGMARAIIHNSNYASIEDCKAAIDQYIIERNEYFKAHPKRAGDKIWGKERVPPVFSPSNNCKDPMYR